MPRDYYVVLGISTSANAEDIHAAFRRRSKELHPDVSGLEAGPFLELQEAYAVLSDPMRRQDYDRESGRGVAVRASRRPPRESVVPLRPRDPGVFIRSRKAPEPIAPRPSSLIDDFQLFRPSFDQLFDRLWGNFGGFSRPKGERVESLTVQVVIAPEEARNGGRICVALPAQLECPNCGGRSAVAGFWCAQCGGGGTLVTERALNVDYPAGTPDGYVVRVPLQRFGIGNFYFTVMFRVAAGDVG